MTTLPNIKSVADLESAIEHIKLEKLKVKGNKDQESILAQQLKSLNQQKAELLRAQKGLNGVEDDEKQKKFTLKVPKVNPLSFYISS
jgi:histidyl-tRNA synthetase